jgi:hypothetical protein
MNPTTVVLSSLVFALTAIHALFWGIYHPPTEISATQAAQISLIESYDWVVDPTCEDHDPCTRDLGRLVGGLKQCKYERVPGECSVQACPPACTNASDCEPHFPLAPQPVMVDGWETRPLRTQISCIAGQCLFGLTRALLASVRQDDADWTHATGPHLAQAGWPCERAMHPTPGLLTESFVLDQDLMSYFDTDVLRWGVPLYPTQLGVCVYTIPCQG